MLVHTLLHAKFIDQSMTADVKIGKETDNHVVFFCGNFCSTLPKIFVATSKYDIFQTQCRLAVFAKDDDNSLVSLNETREMKFIKYPAFR